MSDAFWANLGVITPYILILVITLTKDYTMHYTVHMNSTPLHLIKNIFNQHANVHSTINEIHAVRLIQPQDIVIIN